MGGQVTLNATSGNGYTYLWSNGATTPSITSSTAGTFAVTVTNAFGCSATSSNQAVAVNPLPTVTPITGASSLCANGQIQLANAMTGGIYTSSNLNTATIGNTSGVVSGVAAGTTTISYLYTDNNGCSNTVTYPISVLAAPLATISNSGATSFCQGGSVTLTAAPAASYLWSTGATTASIIASTAGSYSVTLTAANGCSATSAATAVTVNALPTVSILQGSAVSYCAGGAAQLSASPAASYLWSNGANTQTINVNAPGNYSVQVTSTNGCVATSTPTTVTQLALPTALITASGPTTICQGNTVVLTASPASSYAWSNGATTQSITVLNAGSYTVQTSNGSCSASSAPIVVAFNPVPQAVVTASGPTTFCAGGQVTLSAPSGNGFTYLWSNGASTPTITSTAAGNYSVTVTNSNGCSATSIPVAVTVNALPVVPAITGATSVCSNAQVQLSNTITGGVYSSSNASVATIGNLSGLVTGQTPGTTTISYQVSNSNGCSNTVTYPITVLAAPTAALSNSGATSFCQGGSVILTAGAASAYLWNTGQTTQAITVSNTGNYAVTITAANGCSATTLPTSVAVLSLPTVNAIAGSNTVCSNGITTLTNSTSNGLWSSSNTAVATVNTSTGIVAGVTPGSADILYTVVGTNGCSATALKPMTVISPTAATVTAAGATTICQGSTVTLTASAASSYLWSNGATTQSITVAQSGPYNVQTTINGCTATSSNTVVTVVNPPVASISANGLTALCTGGSVTLTAAPASTYAWSTGATTQSITVSAAGSYTVSVSSGGCSATSAPTVVTLNATPSATISASGATSFCQGGSVTLSAPAATSYLWSNGANTQSITVSAAGSYSVSVSSNGCSATSSATAVSILPSPTAVITNTGSTTFCAGGSVVLNGPTAPTGSTFTYVWRLNGTPITGATAVNYTANTAGAYSLVVTNNQGCSTTSGNTTVVVNALPTATITPSGSTTICAGSSLTLTAPAGAAYVWSNGASTQSISVTSAGSYTVTVNANGCTATSTPTVVTVNALPTATITAAGSTTLCQGSSVVLTASPATSYLWSTGATSASITVANAGNYSVALTTNGCSATSAVTTVNVTPLPTPSVSVIGATTFCQGGSVTLTASNAGAYLWSNGATTQTIVVNTPGNYTVQATTNGCAATTAASPVVVNALPTAGITAAGPTTFCQGGSVVLTAAAASSYLWSNGATTQSITVNTSGNYTVQATNANGCSASSAATAVSVQAPPAQPQIVVNGALALCPGSSVTLSAPTAASYLWTNGATTQSIVVSTPGNIGLTVGTAAGCTASAAPVSITALSAPTASITASGSTTLCAGSSVVLTAAPATSYLWSNGATTQSISVQSAGSYTVQATSNGCSATSLPTVVQVNALPVASITASGPLTFCQGGSVTLSAAPATSYLWSNGATTQSITVQNAGTYDVGLTQNGCFAQSAPTQVVVQALPSVNVSASGPLTFCEGSSVTLTADPANTYAWSNGATTQSITVNNSATLTLTSSNGVCSASSSPLNIQVLAAPALSANAGPNAVCVGSTIQLSNATLGGAWSAQDASVATVNASTGEVTALSSGLTNMTYTVVYPNGCSVAATSAISVNTIAPVSIVANGPLSFCNGSSVQLSLPAGFAYQWSTNQVGQNIVVNTAGTYSATVTNAAGCSVQVAPVQVTVFSSPALAIQASTPAICSGQSVNLTANLPAASYSWSNGSQNSSITVQQPGNYALSIIDANGCSASALYTLGTGITPNASVTAAGATNFCAGSNVTLNANNYAGGTYLWSTGATTQSITANTTGSYFVTITSPSGCSAVSNAVVVNVLTAPAASITVTGATTSCSNQSVSLAVSATGTYLWTNNAISQSITPTASGNYGVTVTGANGCTTVVPPVAITILPAPVAQITASGPTTFCEGGSVNLLASGANTYVWNGNQTGAQISATTSGTYSVTATAANGCSDTEQIQVTVNPLPADFIVASGPLSFCEGESVVLSAAPGNTYLWSNGAQTSSVVIAASGTYDAVLTSPAGCVSNTNSLTVQVNQATSSTINATGGNDYLLNGILYTQSGTYTQVLTNAAGCDSTITLNLTLTVGVGENSALSFSVQPNPTDAIFTLKASEALFSNYVIQDAQGKVVATGTLNGTSTTINIDQVARGIYFLKVAEAAEAIRIVKN
ncbi:MAG: T9SS type A sorting domain-containing protein [Flavobacteriia bacterium]